MTRGIRRRASTVAEGSGSGLGIAAPADGGRRRRAAGWEPGGHRAGRVASSAGEVLDDPSGVALLPGFVVGGLATEVDEHVDELAPDDVAAEQLAELGELDQPGGVPGGPVRVLAVGDPVDAVVQVAGLAQEVGDPRRVPAGSRFRRRCARRSAHEAASSWSMHMMLPSLSLNQAALPIPGMRAISPSHWTPGMSW